VNIILSLRWEKGADIAGYKYDTMRRLYSQLPLSTRSKGNLSDLSDSVAYIVAYSQSQHDYMQQTVEDLKKKNKEQQAVHTFSIRVSRMKVGKKVVLFPQRPVSLKDRTQDEIMAERKMKPEDIMKKYRPKE
jgi:hypothetical protein